MPPAQVRGLRPPREPQQETRSLLLSPLSSREAKSRCAGRWRGPGPGCRGKKRPDPSRCQSLAGQRGQAPVFSGAGAGRPANTRGRAAAGHIPSPSPSYCRESYSASVQWNQEIMECSVVSMILLPECPVRTTRQPRHGSRTPPYRGGLQCGVSWSRPGLGIANCFD